LEGININSNIVKQFKTNRNMREFIRVISGHQIFSYGTGRIIKLGNSNQYAVIDNVKYKIVFDDANQELIPTAPLA